ncbi:MAG: hypothetical protein K6F10_00715 [Paludibacteraceae bacterium]|nr:hypothetical protein [Paludibacteraceae bacterium]
MKGIDEQIETIERALGERMIDHALVIVRAWLNELGENNRYESAFVRIQKRYNEVFSHWLVDEKDEFYETLDQLTGETYQLVDAVYTDIRLWRGLSPRMHGFNKENPQSVMRYFMSCVQFTKADFDWLREAANDTSRAAIALMAIGGLSKNIRDCFSLDAFMALVDCMSAENEIVAEQTMAYVFMLLVHYDIRIDFFPMLQDAVFHAIDAEGDSGNHAFEVLCALIRSSHHRWAEMLKAGEASLNQLPDEIRKLLELSGIKDDGESVSTWIPESEAEYIMGLVAIFPDTWLYKLLVEGNIERESTIAFLYLSIGKMDLLWENTDLAEKWLIQHLRTEHAEAIDFINYANCLWLRGDRFMAFENYRRARQMCKNAKDFFTLFRPCRKPLVDHGVPIEQVYMLEDQLLKN